MLQRIEVNLALITLIHNHNLQFPFWLLCVPTSIYQFEDIEKQLFFTPLSTVIQIFVNYRSNWIGYDIIYLDIEAIDMPN